MNEPSVAIILSRAIQNLSKLEGCNKDLRIKFLYFLLLEKYANLNCMHNYSVVLRLTMSPYFTSLTRIFSRLIPQFILILHCSLGNKLSQYFER